MFKNRCTHALPLNDLIQLQYLLGCKRQVICGVSANSTDSVPGTSNVALTFLRAFSVASGATSISVSGPCVLLHNQELRTLLPHLASFYLSHTHSSGWEVSRVLVCANMTPLRGLFESFISPTRLAMNGLKLRLDPLTHHSKFMLSLQNVSRLWSILRTLAIDRASLNPKTAPMSSNLGILVADSGANRILEFTRLVDTVPSLYWYLTQVTTRYTSPDASVKVCKGAVSTCEFNCRQRATYTSDNSVSS